MLPILRRSLAVLSLSCAATLAAQQTTAVPTDGGSGDRAEAAGTSEDSAGAVASGEVAAAEAAPETAAETPAEAEEPEPAPKLVVSQTVLDLGKARKGARLAADFELENAGDAPLKIRSVQPACGCTVASFDNEIEPGAKGAIHAFVDTSALHGGIAKSLTVLSNDRDNPRVLLTIKADVLAYIEAAPSYARIVQVQSQPAQTASLNLWTEEGPPLEVSSVEAGQEWVVATAHRASEKELRPGAPPDQWRIDVSLRDEAPLGPISDQLLVHTNHPQQSVVSIPLSGFVRSVLSPTPAVADFGRLGPKAPDKKRFVLKLFNFGRDPVELKGTAIDLPFVTVSAAPEQEGRRFRIELRLSDDAPKGKFEGTLKLETTSPDLPVVEVPVRGRVG